LVTSIKSSKTPNSQGLTMDLPHVFAPIKEVAFSSLEKESALLEVTTTAKESDINSIKSLDLEFQKTQSKWMVTNIKYNYFNE